MGGHFGSMPVGRDSGRSRRGAMGKSHICVPCSSYNVTSPLSLRRQTPKGFRHTHSKCHCARASYCHTQGMTGKAMTAKVSKTYHSDARLRMKSNPTNRNRWIATVKVDFTRHGTLPLPTAPPKVCWRATYARSSTAGMMNGRA